jgi:hypothetical protein
MSVMGASYRLGSPVVSVSKIKYINISLLDGLFSPFFHDSYREKSLLMKKLETKSGSWLLNQNLGFKKTFQM